MSKTEPSSTILQIHCQDAPGLIHKITGVLFRNNLNIISNGEHVDRINNYFFMRTEFSGNFQVEKIKDELTSVLPKDAFIRLSSTENKRIVILATKEHHCLSDLLVRERFKEINAQICCVISNYENLQDLTNRFEIPYHFITHEGVSREHHEQLIHETISKYNPDLIVLAKYMRILSPDFITKYPNRIINIHHSFLPAFIGANPYMQAYSRGVKIIGATAHFVNENLDEGPIIAQSVIPTDHSQNAKEMAQAGRDVEKIVLAKSLELVLKEKVFVYKNRTIIFD